MKALNPLLCFFVLLSSPLFGQLRSTLKDVTPFDPKSALNQPVAGTGTGTGTGDTFAVGSWEDWDGDLEIILSAFDSNSTGSSWFTWSGASLQTSGVSWDTTQFTVIGVIPFAGAASQHLSAQGFFDAYKARDVSAASKFATATAIAKLNWDAKAPDDPSLTLADDTHIVYDGGSIELKMVSAAGDTWMVDDVVITTN